MTITEIMQSFTKFNIEYIFDSEFIKLRGGEITQEAFIHLCEFLKTDDSIKVLILDRIRNITDMTPLSEVLLCNTSLQNIDLTYTSSDNYNCLFESLKKNKTLIELNLSCIAISNKELICLANSLEENETLQFLNLSQNQCISFDNQQPNAFNYLVNKLKFNKGLKEIDLSCNFLNENFIQDLCEMLIENKTIKKIDVSNNPFCSNRSFNYLINALKRNKTLIDLKFSKDFSYWPLFADILKLLYQNRNR